ncbi:hypothetical protein P171DRAFT_426582 [Karstenula rhodostoma CBS 690.94]|uniref:Uncharacterized protein n=1 Tax=Karstenula rhodostoma CBS 690.94 TaxID=1392251 RepID=A0A9P4UKC5_9PLEO|nr:hypothetical protein P171DRAFT_426582 [Karstenula rhodostoma CBS 690.94]
MSSFFESQTNFVPDASQSFGNEFGRWAASQNLVKGTPQYQKQETIAASQCMRDEYFTPQGRAKLERLRRQREYERPEEEQKNEAADEEGNDVAPEDELPELKDDDDESVVSLDVGFSQAFTSDPYLDRGTSEDGEVSEYPLEPVKEEAGPDTCFIKEETNLDICGIKEEPPLTNDFDIELLPVEDDIDNESVVSMDQGLTQAFTSFTDCGEDMDVPDDEPELPSLSALPEREQLLGWQALCRETGRTVGKTIWECRTSLKRKPYINIIDYIDAARIGAKIELFDDFAQFSHYTRTTPGKRINLKYAKEDELLAALLQKLDGGSGRSKARGHEGNSRQQHSGKREPWRRNDSYRPDGRLPGQPRRHGRSTMARTNPY